MSGLIDLHSHVLPGIDDGAKDVSESLLMLSDSYGQGTEICAATPHCIIHKQEDLEAFIEKREKAFLKLKAAMEESGKKYPEILLGGEVYLDNDLNAYTGLERVCYTNTNYLLLEFPISKMNPAWAEWIYELNRKGIKILVAHVDRYPCWEKMMEEFRDLDVKYQINAARFTKFSDRKLIRSLLEYRDDYIISSDMHNMCGRKCNMAQAYEKASKKFGHESEKLFSINAKKLIG